MQLRLMLSNIAMPLALLIVLGFIPEQGAPVPAYLIIGLVAFSLGRAFLLLLQQTIFSMLPILLLVLPASWTFGFNAQAPLVVEGMLLYLVVVNLQWGQRPWLHGLHLINATLMLAVIFLGYEIVVIPAQVMAYEAVSRFWVGLALIVFVLFFSMYWKRLGRLGAFWALLGVWTYSVGWGQGDYSLLWASLAVLFALSLDSYAMAFIDELTGIPGRRAMEFKLKTIGGNYFLAMADVDHFKKFNDKYGHQVGDDVLKMVANLLSETKKATAYRYGGEEFILLFSKCDSEDVLRYLDETRLRLQNYNLYPKSQKREKGKRGKGSEQKPLHITASFGVARQRDSEPYHVVISSADKALYKAKDKGRNCIVAAK